MFSGSNANSQKPVSVIASTASGKKINRSDVNLFGEQKEFIQNIGQYGQKMKDYEQLGNIQYGYEGLEMPILFTPKGIIHLQRKIENISH